MRDRLGSSADDFGRLEQNNASGFFKDRHWTDREFSALSQLEEGMQGEGGSVGSGEEKRDVKGKGKIVLEARISCDRIIACAC
jgi:hypothetical protein